MYKCGIGGSSGIVIEADLTPEQGLLRDSTLRFIDDVSPVSAVRDIADEGSGLPPGYLTKAAELGWFGMLVPDECGGGSISGAGLVDAALLSEVRGSLVQPGPFIPMNVVAYALSRCGSERHRKDVLPGIIAGECIAVWAISEPGAALAGRGGVTAQSTGDGYRLDGAKTFVQDADIAHCFLLDVVVDGCPRQVLLDADADGVFVQRRESLDVCMRMGRLDVRGAHITEDDFVGTAESTVADINAQLDIASVLCVAETVGAMNRLFEMTVQYAGDRVAFGRPIGSFQALKHQLADMSLQLELSRATAAAAATTLSAADEERPRADASIIVSAAKAFVGDASNQISQGCFQVFGGIGFTWEHDLHLYLRRASMNEVLYGTPIWHRERIVSNGEAMSACPGSSVHK